MREPGRTAIGTWSGGRFLHFGEPIDGGATRSRCCGPATGSTRVLTADAYGQGEADARAGAGADRGAARGLLRWSAPSATTSTRASATARAASPASPTRALRGPDEYADYLRMAAERSLERLGADSFDLLLLHNPDRIGYTSEAVWDGMAALRDAGLAAAIGVAPGPANGFTLDLISCFERFGERIDWAMIILNPFEPWPGELCLDAAARHDVKVITRVVDYGGLFWGDLRAGHGAGPRATTAPSAPTAGSRPASRSSSGCCRSPSAPS